MTRVAFCGRKGNESRNRGCSFCFRLELISILTLSYYTMAIKYFPLNRSKKEIRLLKLLPKVGGNKINFNPACRIFHATLDNKPQYTALSYVWGNEDNMRLIFVENFPVRVRQTLYDAMIALRRLSEPIVMWIDSLCINHPSRGCRIDLWDQKNNTLSMQCSPKLSIKCGY